LFSFAHPTKVITFTELGRLNRLYLFL